MEAFTPDGTSQATTGTPASLIAAIAPATGSRGAPSNPVPSIASTTAPDPLSLAASKGSGGAPGSRPRFARASPRSSAGSPSESTSTSRPSSRRMRAHTSPSPPLLPFPATTRIGRPGSAAAATTRARPAPARSIRSSEGTPASSIAYESAARISSAVKSGSTQSGSAIGAASVPRDAPPYSTVTVFARLRGWSMFRPRARATR